MNDVLANPMSTIPLITAVIALLNFAYTHFATNRKEMPQVRVWSHSYELLRHHPFGKQIQLRFDFETYRNLYVHHYDLRCVGGKSLETGRLSLHFTCSTGEILLFESPSLGDDASGEWLVGERETHFKVTKLSLGDVIPIDILTTEPDLKVKFSKSGVSVIPREKVYFEWALGAAAVASLLPFSLHTLFDLKTPLILEGVLLMLNLVIYVTFQRLDSLCIRTPKA